MGESYKRADSRAADLPGNSRFSMIRNLTFSTMLIVVSLTFSAHAQSPAPQPTEPQTRPRTVTVPPPAHSMPVAAPTPSPTPKPVATQTGPATPAPQAVPSPSPAQAFAAVEPPPTAHPVALSKIRTRITEAQRLLKSRPTPTAMSFSPIDLVRIAALDTNTSQIHMLTLPKTTLLTKGAVVTLTTSLGTLVHLQVVRPNYVNTAVTILDSMGRSLVPLVVEYPIEKRGVFREMAYYTSAHPALLSPDLVKAGQSYVRTMIDLAAKRLHDKGVAISPQILDAAEHLCVVEHIDHERFRLENRIALFSEVYALYGLNELDTFRYSVSSAGAGGMVQMIAPTYQMERWRHPGVGLNPDFVLGMRNHGNALEAMLIYIQDTWNDLSLNQDVIYALNAKIATPADLIAAGYNSNPARLPLYIRRGGAAWRMLIPRETQTYLQIYHSLDSLLPIKPRSNEAKAELK